MLEDPVSNALALAVADLDGMSKVHAAEDASKPALFSKRVAVWLVKRKLVSVERASITAIPVYTVLRPWLRG